MGAASTKIIPIRWDDRKKEVVWLDNSQIPWKESYYSTKSIARLCRAIKSLQIRGAPILGEAGAYGIALAACNSPDSRDSILRNARSQGAVISSARPTAVNLSWGVNKIISALQSAHDSGASATEMKSIAVFEAKRLQRDNISATIKIGENGKKLINDGDVLMTVCNAGTLACDGIGTSTAPIRAAWAEGRRFRVLVTYTAPLYQGARLTAWELHKDGIPLSVITDNAAGHLIREEKVTAVWAGADRILSDGTVYNKIGTYALGILMDYHGGKLYVAAPTSTIDPRSRPSEVRIEQREQEEVRRILGKVEVVPKGVSAMNPAFDRTPPELVSAIITELGVARTPYNKSIKRMLSMAGSMAASP